MGERLSISMVVVCDTPQTNLSPCVPVKSVIIYQSYVFLPYSFLLKLGQKLSSKIKC